ncbi:MAG: hypothetical protein WA603_07500 [Candidatus Acidiferrales bacterium]
MRKFLVAIFVIAAAAPAFAQKLSVKIINREENETEYTYVVPGYSNSNSNTSVNCSGSSSNVNCNGSTHTTETSATAHEVSYHVTGATFSLQLPDGRVAVINSKLGCKVSSHSSVLGSAFSGFSIAASFWRC